MTLLSISSIRLDGGTQIRSAMIQQAVEDYATAMKAGDAFPPVVVFHDGKTYWLADGFHRVQGAILAGEEEISADIRPGTQRDARLFAVGANQTHGLRRSNEDKRRAVEALLDDPLWGSWTDREIARQTGTSHTFVSSLRGKVATLPPKDHMAHGKAMVDGIEWRAIIAPCAGEAEGYYVVLLRLSDGLVIGTKKPIPPHLVRRYLNPEEIRAGLAWCWSFEAVSDESDEEMVPLNRRWSWPHLSYDSKADWIENRWRMPHAS